MRDEPLTPATKLHHGVHVGAALVVMTALAWLGCEDENPILPTDGLPLEFSLEWGDSGSATGQFNHPLRMAIDSTGAVLIADLHNRRIQVFDADGRYLREWGAGEGEMFGPSGIAVDRMGAVYVTDIGGQTIRKYLSNGTPIAQWGSRGGGAGQFDFPMGIAIDSDGNLYVADRNNRRIQKLTSNGEFVREWPAGNKEESRRVWGPHDLAIGPDGILYMVQWQGYQVYRYSLDGDSLGVWGQCCFGPEAVSNVYGIAVEPSGNILLTDIGFPCIAKYTAEGRFLARWGMLGTNVGQLAQPWGIVAGTGGEVYVSDFVRQRILKVISR